MSVRVGFAMTLRSPSVKRSIVPTGLSAGTSTTARDLGMRFFGGIGTSQHAMTWTIATPVWQTQLQGSSSASELRFGFLSTFAATPSR